MSNKTSRLRVGLIEDDATLAFYLSSMLERNPDFQLQFKASNLADGLLALQQNTPDILLTDLGLPDGHGSTAILAALAHRPDCQVLVISSFDDDENIISAIRAGATGYLLKAEMLLDVSNYIEHLHNGGSPMSPRIARRMLRAFRQLDSQPVVADELVTAPAATAQLSSREQTILQALAIGYTYAEIADQEFISINTVRHHIKNIYSKLYVSSKSQAIYEATRRGLLRS